MNFYIYVDANKYTQNKKQIDDFLEITEDCGVFLACKGSDFEDYMEIMFGNLVKEVPKIYEKL
jgi:hypothetical protein